MTRQFLPFEQPIAELEAKIEELRLVGSDSEVNLNDEIERLQKKCHAKTKSIFANLTSWQVVQLARHPLRPHTQDYIDQIFTEFDECHGDRHFSDGASIIGGIARFDDQPVVVIGHEKGRNTAEKLHRNFGMARPEAYRKALRLMALAEKFSLPVFTFIDTAGAYPGIGAEERNQSEAIAKNLFVMSRLKTPIICTVIGEGGSGGALAIGVGDKVLMLQYAVYATISPEGCASILWKNAEKAEIAAQAMGMTADNLLKQGLIDQIIEEPMGGAHRDTPRTAAALQNALRQQLKILQSLPVDKLLAQRHRRLLSLGALG